jgi:hypothetical protein
MLYGNYKKNDSEKFEDVAFDVDCTGMNYWRCPQHIYTLVIPTTRTSINHNAL